MISRYTEAEVHAAALALENAREQLEAIEAARADGTLYPPGFRRALAEARQETLRALDLIISCADREAETRGSDFADRPTVDLKKRSRP